LLRCEQILPPGSAGITLSGLPMALRSPRRSGTPLAAMVIDMGTMQHGRKHTDTGNAGRHVAAMS